MQFDFWRRGRRGGTLPDALRLFGPGSGRKPFLLLQIAVSIAISSAALFLLTGCELMIETAVRGVVYGIGSGIEAAASANTDYTVDHPGGTIALSPAVEDKLQKYLDRHPTKSSYFYVSLDGQSGSAYVCGSNCRIELHAYDDATTSIRAKARAKSACEVGATTECVMLFHQTNAKQHYM